jgi:hypothetical protein
MTTLSIRHPFPENDGKKFVRNFMNAYPSFYNLGLLRRMTLLKNKRKKEVLLELRPRSAL